MIALIFWKHKNPFFKDFFSLYCWWLIRKLWEKWENWIFVGSNKIKKRKIIFFIVFLGLYFISMNVFFILLFSLKKNLDDKFNFWKTQKSFFFFTFFSLHCWWLIRKLWEKWEKLDFCWLQIKKKEKKLDFSFFLLMIENEIRGKMRKLYFLVTYWQLMCEVCNFDNNLCAITYDEWEFFFKTIYNVPIETQILNSLYSLVL